MEARPFRHGKMVHFVPLLAAFSSHRFCDQSSGFEALPRSSQEFSGKIFVLTRPNKILLNLAHLCAFYYFEYPAALLLGAVAAV
jgi:hypothetical protein